MGERFDILPRDCTKQNKFQHFVVWQRPCAAFHEPGPQTLAVIRHVRGRTPLGKRDSRGLIEIERQRLL